VVVVLYLFELSARKILRTTETLHHIQLPAIHSASRLKFVYTHIVSLTLNARSAGVCVQLSLLLHQQLLYLLEAPGHLVFDAFFNVNQARPYTNKRAKVPICSCGICTHLK
jgi:hypothetical protein